MKRGVQAGCMLAALVMIAGPAGAAPRTVASPLCSSAEQTLWHCPLKNHKMSAVCASKKLSATTGYVQYRFGKPGALELTFPAAQESTQQQFRYARYTRPRVTYLALRFTHEGHRYALGYSDDGEAGRGKQGVSLNQTIVFPDGKDQEFACLQRKDTPSFALLEDVVPNEDFLHD